MINISLLQSLINELQMFLMRYQNKITKTDFDSKLSNLNRKTTSSKSKHLLVGNELNKLKTFDLSYFIGKGHFEEGGTQNYLIFQPIARYFKVITDTNYISSWESKGLSAESIKPPTTSDNSLTPELNYYDDSKVRVKFTRSCLKQPKFTHTHKALVNTYTFFMNWVHLSQTIMILR